MTLLNIKEASKLAGISRQHFYRDYIDTGKISVDRSEPKKPKIDIAELLRVFGALHTPSHGDTKVVDTAFTQDDTLMRQKNDFTLQLELERLKAENEGLKAVLAEKQERLNEKEQLLSGLNTEKQYHQGRIETLERRWDLFLETTAQKKSPVEKLFELFKGDKQNVTQI